LSLLLSTLRTTRQWLSDLSVRTKFISYLLVTSLASTALVGGMAYWRLMLKFDDLVLQQSIRGFSADVANYIHQGGTWEAAGGPDGFLAFFHAQRRAQSSQPLDLPPPRHLGMPPPIGASDAETPPPFKFYLFDQNFKALLPLAPYAIGDTVHEPHQSALQPIEHNGKVLAYFSPHGQPNYSAQDLDYLQAMREALVYGTAAAVALTTMLGLLFGNSLSKTIRSLTQAVKAMSKGELLQHVDVRSQDEVGILTEAFNRMSEQLNQRATELRASHAQIQEQAEQLRELSIRDPLTRLHNRRYFDEHCAQLFRQAARYERPLSLVLGDIDHFKQINDRFSHSIGDEVLKQMGEILRSTLRGSDLIARYGGEEFVIAFPETTAFQAHATCESLRKRIENHPWQVLHPDLKVTMSMGLCADLQLGSVQTMLHQADEQLYRAKHEGRNRVCSTIAAA
jgi:two-component system cell cycle response regulator